MNRAPGLYLAGGSVRGGSVVMRCAVRGSALCVWCRHGGRRLRGAMTDRRRVVHRRRRRHRRVRHSDDGKKRRRSLNIADPRREKLAKLYSHTSNSVIEIDAEGDVRATPNNKSSIYCTLSSSSLDPRLQLLIHRQINHSRRRESRF